MQIVDTTSSTLDVMGALDAIQHTYHFALKSLCERTKLKVDSLLTDYLKDNFDYRVGDIVLMKPTWEGGENIILEIVGFETNHYSRWSDASCSIEGVYGIHTEPASDSLDTTIGYETKRILTSTGTYAKNNRGWGGGFHPATNMGEIIGNITDYPDLKSLKRFVEPYHVRTYRPRIK